MNSLTNTLKNGTIALVAVFFIAAPFAAHAADFDDSGWYTDSYSDSYPVDTGYYTDSYTDSYPSYYDDTSWMTDSYTDSYPAYDDTSWITDSYTDSYPMDYGSGYGLSGSAGYPTSYLSGSGYLSSSYLTGPSYIASHPSAPSISNTNVNTNTNTCTNNSCNTNVSAPTTINAPTTVVTNPPAVINNYPSYPAYPAYPVNPPCNTCGCYGYAPCYHPIAYNQTPYISLSQVPYTGLELGFWGTILYWGFLVLWCLIAAYLIVVKKVQNRVLRSLNSFLFGDSVSHTVAQKPVALPQSYSAPVVPQVDAIDPFIVSQINRTRRA